MANSDRFFNSETLSPQKTREVLSFEVSSSILYKKELQRVFLKTGSDHLRENGSKRKLLRKLCERSNQIQYNPIKILEAKGLKNDYYLNILDWAPNGLISIALGDKIITWNSETLLTNSYDLNQFFPFNEIDEYFSSLRFISHGKKLIAGSPSGRISLFDLTTQKSNSFFSVLGGRVSTLEPVGDLLATGTRTGTITLYDFRTRKSVETLGNVHQLEVCGLKVDYEEKYLASGGNENFACIWDLRMTEKPLLRVTDNNSAIKAIAWSPWARGLVAFGAGSMDRRIRLWSTSSTNCISSTMTPSQVCSIHWISHRNEMVSCHGYLENDIRFWDYPSMTCITTIPAHQSRILQSCLSPDGSIIATAAADEQLKFWLCK